MKSQSRNSRGMADHGSVVWALALWLSCSAASAQTGATHSPLAGNLPPGTAGQMQLLRGGPLEGYFQPVEIRGPEGVEIATAGQGNFEEPAAGKVLVGLQIGQVYRFRVTGIPQQEGLDVYPTVEVIDRLYPPVGKAKKYPIDVELTQDELEMALEGKFVTRVIYVEEPLNALPITAPEHQAVLEIERGDDLMAAADRLGRPVAILRIGGRLPDPEGPSEQFLFGSPALIRYPSATPPMIETVAPGNQVRHRSSHRARPALARGQGGN